MQEDILLCFIAMIITIYRMERWISRERKRKNKEKRERIQRRSRERKRDKKNDERRHSLPAQLRRMYGWNKQ